MVATGYRSIDTTVDKTNRVLRETIRRIGKEDVQFMADSAEVRTALGRNLLQLKKPADACRVYDELASAYPDKLTGALKTRVTAARAEAKCK